MKNYGRFLRKRICKKENTKKKIVKNYEKKKNVKRKSWKIFTEIIREKSQKNVKKNRGRFLQNKSGKKSRKKKREKKIVEDFHKKKPWKIFTKKFGKKSRNERNLEK